MIENEVNHDDDDGRQFSMDLSTHSRFAMAFDLKVPPPYVSPSLHYEPKTTDFIQKLLRTLISSSSVETKRAEI